MSLHVEQVDDIDNIKHYDEAVNRLIIRTSAKWNTDEYLILHFTKNPMDTPTNEGVSFMVNKAELLKAIKNSK